MLERITNLAPQLRREQEEPATLLHFEAQLAREGLLEELERTGILPTIENPNPHDPSRRTHDHDSWWRDHPDERKAFRESVRKREQALRQIQAGSMLEQRRQNR